MGTVHHLAWRAIDNEDHKEWREHIANHGYGVTPFTDRQYFDAIYFREDGGILFEVATDPPGFAHDETKETMGSKLMLPPWLEEKGESWRKRYCRQCREYLRRINDEAYFSKRK